MQLGLAPTTEVAGPMATEGVAAMAVAMVAVEVAGPGEDGREDIELSGRFQYLKITQVVP